MNKNQKPANQKRPNKHIGLETLNELGEIGKSAARTMQEEVKRLPSDFMGQLLGIKPANRYSGEIEAGSSLKLGDILAGNTEQMRLVQKQTYLERRLLQEEKVLVERKSNELKIQLKVLQEELLVIATKTQDLAQETQIAALQAPVEPGVYHVIFFEKLLEFIKSFSKKIEEAGLWLHAVNKRAVKKNRWGANYKKHGAKYLLSGEHYLQRSAG